MKRRISNLIGGSYSNNGVLLAFFLSFFCTVIACFSQFYFSATAFDSFSDSFYANSNREIDISHGPISIEVKTDSDVDEYFEKMSALQKEFPSNSDNAYVFGRSYFLCNQNSSESFSISKSNFAKVSCPVLVVPYLSKFVSYLGTYLVCGNYGDEIDDLQSCAFLSQHLAKEWISGAENYPSLTGEKIIPSKKLNKEIVIKGVLGNGIDLDRTPYYLDTIGPDFLVIQDSSIPSFSEKSFVFEIGKSTSVTRQKMLDSNKTFCSKISTFCRSLKNPVLSYLRYSKTSDDQIFEANLMSCFSFYLSTKAVLLSFGYLFLAVLSWVTLFISFFYLINTMVNLHQGSVSLCIVFSCQYFVFFPISLLLLKGNSYYSFFVESPIFLLSGKGVALYLAALFVFIFFSFFYFRAGIKKRGSLYYDSK